MELIDRILDDENINAAIHAVQSNKGAPGIDKMPVGVLKSYFAENGEEIKAQMSLFRCYDINANFVDIHHIINAKFVVLNCK